MKVTPRYLKVDDHEIKLEPNFISEMLCAAPGPVAVHVDFAQLNCKRNSLLAVKQQFNIACNQFTVADNKIRSSAHICQPTWQPLTLQPALRTRRLMIQILTKTVNIAGENELPSLTPQPTLNTEKLAVFHFADT